MSPPTWRPTPRRTPLGPPPGSARPGLPPSPCHTRHRLAPSSVTMCDDNERLATMHASAAACTSFSDDIATWWCATAGPRDGPTPRGDGDRDEDDDDDGTIPPRPPRPIPVLETPPSSLVFLRDYVSVSRPCLIQHALLRGGSSGTGGGTGRSRTSSPTPRQRTTTTNDLPECVPSHRDQRDPPGPPPRALPRHPLIVTLDDVVRRDPHARLTVAVTPDGHGDCVRRVAVPPWYPRPTEQHHDGAPLPFPPPASRGDVDGSAQPTHENPDHGRDDRAPGRATTLPVPHPVVVPTFVEPAEWTMTVTEFRARLRRRNHPRHHEDHAIASRVFDARPVATAAQNHVHIWPTENTHDKDDTIRGSGPRQVHDEYILYYSRQNDCLRQELPSLWGHVVTGHDDALPSSEPPLFPASFPWAEAAFGTGPPDAVNLWIGDARSVSSIHKDHYENLFYVLSGEKHFTLYPPADVVFLTDHDYPSGRFVYQPSSLDLNDGPGVWYVEPHVAETRASPPGANGETHRAPSSSSSRPAPPRMTRWISNTGTNDGDHVSVAAPTQGHPREVVVRAGEMLYLPALWFHRVTQTYVGIGESDAGTRSNAGDGWRDGLRHLAVGRFLLTRRMWSFFACLDCPI